jgi:hypothetical protein
MIGFIYSVLFMWSVYVRLACLVVSVCFSDVLALFFVSMDRWIYICGFMADYVGGSMVGLLDDDASIGYTDE